MIRKSFKPLYLTVLLQQQRYIIAISFLFYLHNGLSLSTFLLFQSIFYFTGLLAEIPAGYIGDIFSRKKILIFSYMLFVIRIILWIVMPNYYTILFGEILYALSKAFYRGVSDGYIYDYLKGYHITDLMLSKYGKFNFFMSTGSAISSLIGAALYKYVGFTILLYLELFWNIAAICILLFLPNIKQKRKCYSLKNHLKRIFNIINTTISNNKLNIYIVYSAILFGVTSIFVWTFQPIMKHFFIPVYIFGVIYFINHMLRALFSLEADRILNIIKLPNLGFIVWILYTVCFFILSHVLLSGNKYFCVAALIFVCIAIGVQMSYNVGNLSRVHSIVRSDTRATVSSVNSMLSSFFSGLFLFVFKFLADHNSLALTLIIFMVLFMFSLYIINKISVAESN